MEERDGFWTPLLRRYEHMCDQPIIAKALPPNGLPSCLEGTTWEATI